MSLGFELSSPVNAGKQKEREEHIARTIASEECASKLCCL